FRPLLKPDQPVRFRVWQRLEQNAIDDAVHHRGGSAAEGKRAQGDGGETPGSSVARAGHNGTPATGPPASVCRGRRGNLPLPAPGRPAPAGLAAALPSGRSPARSDRPRVVPDGSAIPYRAALPVSSGATDGATSSLCTSLRNLEDQADGFRQALPTGGFGFELRPPLARPTIEFGLTPGLGGLPIGSQPAAIFQPVQRRVERALRNLDHIARHLLQALRDGVPVYRAQGGNGHDQQVQGAL